MTILDTHKKDFLDTLESYDDFDHALSDYMSGALIYDYDINEFYIENMSEIDETPVYCDDIDGNSVEFFEIKKQKALNFLYYKLNILAYEVA